VDFSVVEGQFAATLLEQLEGIAALVLAAPGGDTAEWSAEELAGDSRP
jgi:hypothetical protein